MFDDEDDEDVSIARVCFLAGYMPHLDEAFPTPKPLSLAEFDLVQSRCRARRQTRRDDSRFVRRDPVRDVLTYDRAGAADRP